MPLLSQRPAAENRPARDPERKSLLGREAQRGLCPLPSRARLSAELMDHGREVQGVREAEGVSQLLGLGQRVVDAFQGLVGIAKQPPGPGEIDQAAYPGVITVAERMGAVLLRVVERDALLEVRSGRGQFSQPEQCLPKGVVGFEKESRRLNALGEGEELLPEFPRRLKLPPRVVEPPEPSQDGEELRCLAHLPAQLKGPGIGPFHLGGTRTLAGEQRRAEGGLQDQLLLGALRAVGECCQRLEPLGEVRDRFGMGRALDGALACLLPVGDRLLYKAGLRVVMSQQLRLGLDGLGEALRSTCAICR